MVKTTVLLLRSYKLESEVFMQLADWGSVIDPLSTGDSFSSTCCSVSTAPVASQWPKDLIVPTGGTKDDCDGVIP